MFGFVMGNIVDVNNHGLGGLSAFNMEPGSLMPSGPGGIDQTLWGAERIDLGDRKRWRGWRGIRRW